MGFDFHVKKHHNMWNYIFYLIYLERKGFEEHSNLESYIWNCYLTRKFQWLPNSRSIDLEENNEETSQPKIDYMGKLEESLVILTQQLDKLTNTDAVTKKLNQTETQVQATLQGLRMIEQSKKIKYFYIYLKYD